MALAEGNFAEVQFSKNLKNPSTLRYGTLQKMSLGNSKFHNFLRFNLLFIGDN